jgi:ribonuclease T2
MGHCFSMLAFRLVAALIFLLGPAFLSSADAQDRRQNTPGEFDFYVLSLSWSPSFCASAEERGNAERSQAQCSARPFSFVVHGLWPQYERGFPEYCERSPEWVDRNTVSAMLDLMPAQGLIVNEWKKHGTCSGLRPRAYFETIRKARAAVKIPDELLQLSKPKMISPEELEADFIKANPGLTATAISVTCDSRRLNEVRICMGKDLQFRACGENDRRACKREQVLMPPVRGG